MYAYFYCCQAGVQDPWRSSEVKVFASGDDVIIFCDKRFTQKINSQIRRYAADGDLD